MLSAIFTQEDGAGEEQSRLCLILEVKTNPPIQFFFFSPKSSS